MNVSFQNANPRKGDESYLLKFHDDVGDSTACLLVDAGDGVDPDFLLDDNEMLVGVLVTHAHMDHVKSLSAVAEKNVPIFTSPDTAAVLEDIIVEGEKNYAGSDTSHLAAEFTDIHDDGSWDTDAVADLIEPVSDWHQVFPDVEVHPISVGHAPGACGFIVRFEDATDTHHILVTGDFTFQNVAGYDAIDVPPIDIDAVFLNSPTGDDDVITEAGVNTELSDAIGSMFEAATAGQRVVTAAGALSGVHIAYLLDRAISVSNTALNVRVAGLTAKIYEDLDYDLEHVTATPVYSEAEEVLDPGTITITGPEEPTGGGSAVLFDAIQDDPNAAFVQVLTAGNAVSSAKCTLSSYDYVMHPRQDAIHDFINDVAPMEVIVRHGNHHRYKDEYEASFVWTVDDISRDFTLYYTGRWHPPEWVHENVERQIRSANQNEPTFEETFGAEQIADFNPVTRAGVEKHTELECPETEDAVLYHEGVTVERIPGLALTGDGPEVKAVEEAPDVETTDTPAEPGTGDASGADTGVVQATDGGTATVPRTEPHDGAADPAPTAPPESPGGAAAATADGVPEAVGGGGHSNELAAIRARLAALEEAVTEPTVPAKVVDAGDGVTLLRVNSDVADDLEHSDEIAVTID